MSGSSRLVSRLAALGLLVVLGWALWAFAVAPALRSVSETRVELGRLTEEEVRLHFSLARLTQEVELSDSDDLGAFLWQARQAGEATARIQARLGELSRIHGITLRSITPAAAPPLAYAEAISLRVEADADLAQLTGFIMAIEQHEPALLVSRATLRRLNRPGTFSEQPIVFFQLDLVAPFTFGEG